MMHQYDDISTETIEQDINDIRQEIKELEREVAYHVFLGSKTHLHIAKDKRSHIKNRQDFIEKLEKILRFRRIRKGDYEDCK